MLESQRAVDVLSMELIILTNKIIDYVECEGHNILQLWNAVNNDVTIFQGLPSRVFEFWRLIAGSKFDMSILSNDIEKSNNGHMGYTMLKHRSPEEFFMALAIGLLLQVAHWNKYEAMWINHGFP